jgi:hypothetical protein
MRFRVHLNGSYDDNAGPEFVRFPEDSSRRSDLGSKEVSAERVVDLLWRNGLVPQWVNVQVVAETGDATVLDITACGRFTGDDSNLYYADTEYAPFGPKGPWLPVGYVDGQRFSIYEQSACWSRSDLDRVRLHAPKVWSLELNGGVFNDQELALGLEFPRLQILELHGVRVSGAGFRSLVGLPRIHHLRASFDDIETLCFDDMPVLEHLESLSIQCAPSQLLGIARLATALPHLGELTLGSLSNVRADATLEASGVQGLTLEFPTVPEWINSGRTLRTLSLHSERADDAQVARFLRACPDALTSLSLRGTPVTDDVLDALTRFQRLEYLNVVGTGVSALALERFAEVRRGLRFHPRKVSQL